MKESTQSLFKDSNDIVPNYDRDMLKDSEDALKSLSLMALKMKLVSLSILQFGVATLKNLLLTVLCLIPVLLFNYYYDFTLGNAFLIVLSIAAFMPFWWLMWLWLTKHGLFKEIFSSRASS